MTELISVNGCIATPEEAVVSPLDRGFLYGDSVYETIRTYSGRPFSVDRHLQRLRRSADRVGIPLASAKVDLNTEISRVLLAAGNDESAIRVIVSRGVGPVGYDTEAVGLPTCVVHVRPFPHPPAHWMTEGIDVAIVGVVRNAIAALDPAIKSSNLLNNLLAWREARRLRADEPILLNAAGELAEGASSNLFVVREGRLLTPPVEAGILRGVTRDLALELARAERIDTAEIAMHPDRLRQADEAFVTSTMKGILAVRRCDGWPIREGRPGPITRRLMQRFARLVQEETKAGSSSGASRK